MRALALRWKPNIVGLIGVSRPIQDHGSAFPSPEATITCRTQQPSRPRLCGNAPTLRKMAQASLPVQLEEPFCSVICHQTLLLSRISSRYGARSRAAMPPSLFRLGIIFVFPNPTFEVSVPSVTGFRVPSTMKLTMNSQPSSTPSAPRGGGIARP